MHKTKIVKLGPNWFWSCSCGESATSGHEHKARANRLAAEHVRKVKR